MKIFLLGLLVIFSISCKNNMKPTSVVFLHHSTGGRIWKGNVNKYVYKVTKRSDVEKWIRHLEKKDENPIQISQMTFPKKEPYGWKNYPYDYYNIWVRHAGNESYKSEPTLEMLTKDYKIIIWKHCFPVSDVMADTIDPGIDSEIRTLSNYKLQYDALKEKMHQFPENMFLVWTPAPLVEGKTNEGAAKRIREFYKWIINQWDEKGDNIYLWDYYILATDGGLYLTPDNADGPENSHPNTIFSGKISRYFANRIIHVAYGEADNYPITGMDNIE